VRPRLVAEPAPVHAEVGHAVGCDVTPAVRGGQQQGPVPMGERQVVSSRGGFSGRWLCRGRCTPALAPRCHRPERWCQRCVSAVRARARTLGAMTTTSATVARERTAAGTAAVPALAVGAFAIGTDIHVVAGVLGGLANEFGVPVGAAGLAATVFALGYAVGAPLLSAAVAARPPRPVLLGSLVLYGLLTALSALAPTLPVLLATRALAALACCVVLPTAAATAVAAAPEHRRGRALGTILVGSSAGAVLGAPLGTLLAALLSWRATFGLVALLTAVAVVRLLRTPISASPLPPSTVLERLRPARLPPVLGLLGVTFLVVTASSSTYTYLGVLVGGSARLALLIAVFGLAGIAGVGWGGAAVDRFGGPRVALAALVVLAAGFAVLPSVAAGLAALPVMAGWGALVWAFVPAQQHRLLALRVGPAPVLLALNTSAIHLGFAAGALLGGLVVDAGGPLWVLAVGCCAGALLLHTVLNPREST
jgi:predicted MFS family arabinose efflux permease